jgi:hypothetical protein
MIRKSGKKGRLKKNREKREIEKEPGKKGD